MEGYADHVYEATITALPGWVERVATERAAAGGVSVTLAILDRVSAATVALVEPELRRVLDSDVDAGAGSPLEAVRAAVGPVTELLEEMGAAKPRRDEFTVRAFPLDHYDIGPAAFSDIDPALHGPGLVWGAARAHVHLRRRRATSGD